MVLFVMLYTDPGGKKLGMGPSNYALATCKAVKAVESPERRRLIYIFFSSSSSRNIMEARILSFGAEFGKSELYNSPWQVIQNHQVPSCAN